MMRLELAPFSATPFPHGQGAKVFDDTTYAALLAAWPNEATFKTLAGPYRKSSLSERCNPDAYAAFIAASWPWRMFHGYIKSETFRATVFTVLRRHGVTVSHYQYTSRFEFSSLPSDGGAIAPHRDIPSKVLTIVVPMTLEHVPGWGTDILEPLPSFDLRDVEPWLEDHHITAAKAPPPRPWKDYETPRYFFRTVTSFDYAPNTCGIFVKTDDSWHAIGPLKGPAGQFRRTLTINIERA